MDGQEEETSQEPTRHPTQQYLNDILEEGSRLIDRVNRELHLYHALTTPTHATTSTSTSPTTSGQVCTISHRRGGETLAEEIARISRFCDSIDDIIFLYPSRPNTNVQTANRTGNNDSNGNSSSNSNSNSSAGPSGNNSCDVVASINISSTPPIRQQVSRASGPEIIDLSYYNADLDTIIDLCTPPAHHRRQTRHLSYVNRRVLEAERSYNYIRSITSLGRRSGNSGTTLQQRNTPTIDISAEDGPTSSKVVRMNISTENSSGGDDFYKCPVCLENVRNRDPTSTKCGHVFCSACIQQVVRENRKCPMCNGKVHARSLFRIYL